MQAFQTHTAAQPISIQPLQTQQKPCVTEVQHNAEKHSLFVTIMAYSDRTYVWTGPGPEWVTVFYVKPSHCNLCGNLNMSYTLALYQSWHRPGPGAT